MTKGGHPSFPLCHPERSRGISSPPSVIPTALPCHLDPLPLCHLDQRGEISSTFLLRYKHPPAAIFLAPFHVLLANQLIQQFLYRSDTNARLFPHIRQRQRRLCPHGIQ